MNNPPATLTLNGKTWTYAPGPLPPEFARGFGLGRRRATLMLPRGKAVARFISVSGRLLGKVEVGA